MSSEQNFLAKFAQQQQQQGWFCTICTTSTGYDLFKCQACDTPRPGYEHMDSSKKVDELRSLFGSEQSGFQQSETPASTSFDFGFGGSGGTDLFDFTIASESTPFLPQESVVATTEEKKLYGEDENKFRGELLNENEEKFKKIKNLENPEKKKELDQEYFPFQHSHVYSEQEDERKWETTDSEVNDEEQKINDNMNLKVEEKEKEKLKIRKRYKLMKWMNQKEVQEKLKFKKIGKKGEEEERKYIDNENENDGDDENENEGNDDNNDIKEKQLMKSKIYACGSGGISGVLGRQFDNPDETIDYYPKIINYFLENENIKSIDEIASGAMTCIAICNGRKMLIGWGTNEQSQLGTYPLTVPNTGDDDQVDNNEELLTDIKNEYRKRMIEIYEIIKEDKKEEVEKWLKRYEKKKKNDYGDDDNDNNKEEIDLEGTAKLFQGLYERIYNKYNDKLAIEKKGLYEDYKEKEKNEKEEIDMRKLQPYHYHYYENKKKRKRRRRRRRKIW
ncbi:erythrocyte binding protein [Reticulomyxa filosa]|uniref:Erythrocyte binding protein n=1 Tax=Reticulomyxa filosa TaxID=46433 RepID=X6P1N5_RETFI|nr:erythrocyte binding protein [Reticulomyxa filosa]|eukprot:ETO32053.1 erythrocyte binding protein [Reticulomyxa filosa]